MTPHFVVQASSHSWAGDIDLCMKEVQGHPVIYWTIKNILSKFPDNSIYVAAPEFDRGGFESLFTQVAPFIYFFYGSNDDPLKRIVDCTIELDENDYIIRIDGLHFCADIPCAIAMLEQAKTRNLDCIKLPDDWPVQFTSDIYRVGALRLANKLLAGVEDRIYRVHPKYFMFHSPEFKCEFSKHIPVYTIQYLNECRDFAQPIYKSSRTYVDKNNLWVGNQYTFHYEIASKYIEPWMKVLDVACGNGYGTKMLAPYCREIYGADINWEIIEQITKVSNYPDNIFFDEQDVTSLTYPSDFFDAVVSLETIEHVDSERYFSSIYRVLKQYGVLILSTPQNCMGHVPIVSCHQKEFTLEEIVSECEQYFKIIKVIGIKQGRIYYPNDPHGNNVMIVCQKE